MVGLLIDIDREEAARAAREELSKSAYTEHEPGWLELALGWLIRQLNQILDSAAGTIPGGLVGLLLLLALLVAAFVVIRWRLGAVSAARRRIPDTGVFTGGRRSAAEHRAAGSDAAGLADWDTAVREAFRAIVANLTERTVLQDRAGRTADETAREVGDRAPAVAAAARVFDEVAYGDRTATEQAYATVREADEAARLVRA